MKDCEKHESIKGAKNSSLDNRIFALYAALLVATITFLLYLPVLKNGFVNYDDDLYVLDNPILKIIDLNFLKKAFLSTDVSLLLLEWHPLTVVSLALDYAVWGLEPFGYHLTNVLLHSLNTFLVFILIARLFTIEGMRESRGVFFAAFTASLLFGIHPVHVESVAWVSERKDVLSAFFYLISLVSYLGYAVEKSKICYALCLTSFIFAVLSKPMAISLPAVLLILDYFPLKRFGSRVTGFTWSVILEKLPFIAFSILSISMALWVRIAGETVAPIGIHPIGSQILVAAQNYIFYLTKMTIPFNLSPFYPYPREVSLLSLDYAASTLFLIAITFYSLRSSKKGKVFFVVCLYYLVTLLPPVIAIVQVGYFAAADRYTYLPSLGPFLLAGFIVSCGFERCSKKQRLIIITTLSILFLVLVGKSIKQISIWRDSITLWSHVIKIFPDSADIAYYNRGNAYDDIGERQQAMNDFYKAIEINPRYANAFFNLGLDYARSGDFSQAIGNYTRGLTLRPSDAKGYYHRGIAFYNIGNYKLAMKDFEIVIDLDPQYAEAYYQCGLVYFSLGEYTQAIKGYSIAIEINPKYADAYNNRGNASLSMGNLRKAKEDFRRALELNPQMATAYYNLGVVYTQLGDQENADYYYQKAAALGLK